MSGAETSLAGKAERAALTNSSFYFQEILTPNRDAYFEGPVTFASAFNFATSLFHFHEWLFEDYRNRLITLFGLTPKDGKIKASMFWSKVQETDERFGYIRDVANASKHMVLMGSTSTGVKNIGQTSLQSVGFGMGAYGVGRYSGPNLVVVDGDKRVSFDDCAAAMLAYWRGLLEELLKGAGS